MVRVMLHFFVVVVITVVGHKNVLHAPFLGPSDIPTFSKQPSAARSSIMLQAGAYRKGTFRIVYLFIAAGSRGGPCLISSKC